MNGRTNDSGSFATVGELVVGALERYPERSAVALPERTLSYADLGGLLAGAAAYLRAGGLSSGDRVAIVGPNELAYIVACGAAQCCGIATVEAGYRESLEMLRDMVAKSRAKLVITERDDLRAALAGGVHAVSFADFLGECRTRRGAAASLAAAAADIAPQQTAAIVFTSGTTGTPKGVVLSHANFAFVVAAIIRYLDLQPTDRYALVLPLNHTYGKTVMLSTFGAGAALSVQNDFTNLPEFLHAVARQRCTILSLVPYHAQIMLQRGDLTAYDLSAVRALTFSGNKLYPDTLDRLNAALPAAQVFSMYGLTESTTRSCYVPPDRLAAKKESCGRPLPGVTVKIVDETGRERPAGKEGEVLIQGPNLMQGYLDDPALTATTLADGWLHTGDLGHLDDDGFLYLRGRKSEIIKCAGERISPLEIENVLLAHPAVLEAAVVGHPDPLLGEAVHAYIVPSGDGFDRAELARFCAQRLSPHKLPRQFIQQRELPKTPTGKIKRNLLRDKSLEESA
jgi:long-chain acyl-CoA synthetase